MEVYLFVTVSCDDRFYANAVIEVSRGITKVVIHMLRVITFIIAQKEVVLDILTLPQKFIVLTELALLR